jgi:hypothetical protein
MFYYIPQIILFLSLIIAIWVVARNFPKIKNEIDLEKENSKIDSVLENDFFSRAPIEKLDTRFNEMLEKMLRRFRIFVIKFDNRIARLLNSVKKSTKQKNIFKVSKDIKEEE